MLSYAAQTNRGNAHGGETAYPRRKYEAEMWKISSYHVKYKPICEQWEFILKRVNRARKKAGFDLDAPDPDIAIGQKL